VNLKTEDSLENDSVESTIESQNFKIPKKKENSGKLKLPKELNIHQKMILQSSLYRALKVKGIEFDDDLIFNDPECPPEMNDSSLEIGIQKISNYNKEIYYKFKRRSKVGEYPPLEIVDDQIQVKLMH
jgi:hypothetical protein